MFSDQAIKTYSSGKPNYTQPDEVLMKRVMDGIPDMPIKVQDKRSFEEFAQSFAQSAQVIGIPKKEWVNLTVEERETLRNDYEGSVSGLISAVQMMLKEKNT
jgi:hypothetical protein